MRIDRRLLGWGLFLIIVGAVPLLVRGDYLDADVVKGWPSLWPILLIGWGLALVLRRTPGEVVGSAVSVVVLGVMVGGLIATGFGGFPAFGACGNGAGGTGFGDRSGTLGESGRASIEFNCGTLDVAAVDGSDWSISGTDADGRGPDVSADSARVTIRPRDQEFTGFFDRGSDWRINLPRTPMIDLGITLNAGDASVDMTGATVHSLGLTLNAGSIDIDLAGASGVSTVSTTLNAGSATLGLPGSVSDASMTLNAGSITVCLPAGTPLRVSWSGALGSNNFDAQGLTKIDDQHWTSAGLDSSSGSYLELNVSANLGSFSLDLGGSCNA